MMKFLERAIQDISKGQNLEHYITLLFIFVIFTLDIFNLASPDILANITLAVLALVVFTSLSVREDIGSISEKLLKEQGSDNFFWRNKRSVESDLSRAKYIGFVGASLSRTLRDYSAILEERLELGAQVRIILMDPNSTAPDQAVLRSKGISNRQFYVDSLRPTLERIGILSKTFEKIELGLLPYKPAFGMIIIDPNESHGKIIVEMYPHHSDSFSPTFELHSNRDIRWYGYFLKQFYYIWDGCKERHFSGESIHELVEEVRSISSAW